MAEVFQWKRPINSNSACECEAVPVAAQELIGIGVSCLPRVKERLLKAPNEVHRALALMIIKQVALEGGTRTVPRELPCALMSDPSILLRIQVCVFILHFGREETERNAELILTTLDEGLRSPDPEIECFAVLSVMVLSGRGIDRGLAPIVIQYLQEVQDDDEFAALLHDFSGMSPNRPLVSFHAAQLASPSMKVSDAAYDVLLRWVKDCRINRTDLRSIVYSRPNEKAALAQFIERNCDRLRFPE